MKQVLIATSLILMLFFFDKLKANELIHINWDDRSFLRIEDFKEINDLSVNDKSISPLPTVFPVIVMSPSFSSCNNKSDKLNPRIETIFIAEDSWIKNQNISNQKIQNSLAYANLKFLITEVYSRKLRRRIEGANFTCEEENKFLDIFNEVSESLKNEIVSLNETFPKKKLDEFFEIKTKTYSSDLNNYFKFSSHYKDSLKKIDVPWSKDLNLTWDDYQAPPPYTDFTRADAITSSAIVFIHNCSNVAENDKLNEIAKIEAYSVFLPHESWVREHIPGTPKYDHVLEHEKIHFDITELYTRKLKQKLSQKNYTCAEVDEFMKIYDEVFFQLLEAQTNYDVDTGSSMHELEHPGLHYSIHQDIQDQLKQLEDYAI